MSLCILPISNLTSTPQQTLPRRISEGQSRARFSFRVHKLHLDKELLDKLYQVTVDQPTVYPVQIRSETYDPDWVHVQLRFVHFPHSFEGNSFNMGSATDVYAILKKELESNGSKAQVILPGDGEVYEQSIERWSDHCVKRAVRLPSYPIHPSQADRLIPVLRPQAHHFL